MVATSWLFLLLTTVLLTASECIYVSPLPAYQLSDTTSLGIQNNFLTLKRTKPSLSIVNPLDVLRQRLILEMARRQMRENTKQVEINRAILKNVGKRSSTNKQKFFHSQQPEINEKDPRRPIISALGGYLDDNNDAIDNLIPYEYDILQKLLALYPANQIGYSIDTNKNGKSSAQQNAQFMMRYEHVQPYHHGGDILWQQFN